jgi:hypothetical protein
MWLGYWGSTHLVLRDMELEDVFEEPPYSIKRETNLS